jgi:hypothetical protein
MALHVLYKHRETSFCPFFAFTCRTADFAFPLGVLRQLQRKTDYTALSSGIGIRLRSSFSCGPAETQIFADFFSSSLKFFFVEPLSLEQVDLIAFVEELFFSYKGCAGESDGGVDTAKYAKLPKPVTNWAFVSKVNASVRLQREHSFHENKYRFLKTKFRF